MWNLIYLYVFLLSLLLSLVLTPLMRRLAVRLRVLDQPAERKIHGEAKPLLGGLAIYLSFLLTIGINLALLMLLRRCPELISHLPDKFVHLLPNVRITFAKLGAILVGAIFIFLIGLLDDIKHISAGTKLLGQILVALILIWSGIRISLFTTNVYLSTVITVLWVVAIINAFNLLDNMDGLSSGVAFIATAIFFSVAFQQQQLFVSTILAVFAGSLLGFLRYNIHPASVFMGDAGSMFIGYILATLTIISTYYTKGCPTFLPIIMPLLILSIPIFDTASVIWIRARNRRPLFAADKNHLSHRLVALGMGQKRAVFLIYLITFCVGILATLLRRLDSLGAIVVLVQVVAIFSIVVTLEIVGARRSRGD